jgi:hypothetical protein
MYHHLTLTIISFLIIALIQVTEEELIDQVKDFFFRLTRTNIQSKTTKEIFFLNELTTAPGAYFSRQNE